MHAAALLRTARHAQGVTQRALAQAADVHQPGVAAIESGARDTTVSTLEQLLAAVGHRLAPIPTRTRGVWEAAEAVRMALITNDERSAWREVIALADDLAREPGPTRVALSVTQPPDTGRPEFNALIAAITDYRLSADRLPRPDWLDSPHFRLAQVWDVEEIPELRAEARHRTPRSIARHGIYLHERELESV